MYSDRKEKNKSIFLWAGLLLLAAVLGLLLLSAFGHPGNGPEDNGAAAIRSAVQRSALQCYAVEGVYPPNLQYLEDNYGLQVNTTDYYVSYEAFASNLPPTVKVIHRESRSRSA